VIFPFVVAAPRFFSGAIQLGELMQISSAFGRVQDSLSWLVDNYDRVAAWRATTDRLTGFEEAILAPAQCTYSLNATKNDSYSDPISIELNTIAHPDGTPMITGLCTQLRPGDRVQLQGASGTGKSTVLRTMAGVWPWVQGQITWPAGQREQAAFVAQRPYFPEGSLRDALHYPQTQLKWSDETLRQALTQAQLPGLLDALDTTDAWGRRLSGGEQQRLALARVLLRQPRWLFLDEATSALDADTERAVLAAIEAMVAQQHGAIVEIRHRAAAQVAGAQTQPIAQAGSPPAPQQPCQIWQLAVDQSGQPAQWTLAGLEHSTARPPTPEYAAAGWKRTGATEGSAAV
jgi:putative ATP-binding cassette transporter